MAAYQNRLTPEYTGIPTTLEPPYLPTDEIKQAVNLAVFLRRPLLIQGEPGCGKTRLAEAVAAEFGWKYLFANVKSNSRARDLLYRYDTIGRLRDAQLLAAYKQDAPEFAELRQKTEQSYLHYEALGEAILSADKPAVVLIDEIDKADLDFPNDLLYELDRLAFKVEEIPSLSMKPATHEPVVFITSNSEKELPDAFLRRCVYLYIDFPSSKFLHDILMAHFEMPKAHKKDLVELAVSRFTELRKQMQADDQAAGKKVSTSELIDWFRVLRDYVKDEDKALQMLNGKLPFPEVLLKSWDSHKRYLKAGG